MPAMPYIFIMSCILRPSSERVITEESRKPVYYVTDRQQQGQYINMFKEQGMDAVILDHNIDTSHGVWGERVVGKQSQVIKLLAEHGNMLRILML